MEKAFNSIKLNKLFAAGDTVGVACSGGADSMALLHFLSSNKEKLDIDVVCVHVDHVTREADARDAAFVAAYCRENFIKFHKFKVESLVIARQKGYSLEQATREGRYGLFDSILKRHLVDKIALGHHLNDQAETILLNVLRGSGLKGASGMQPLRDGIYARPFLDIPKTELTTYCYQNDVPFVEDETNLDNRFSRNLLRNDILPKLREVWSNVDESIVSFGSICREDDEFISRLMNFSAVIYGDAMVKVPLNYFVYEPSLISRLLRLAFEHLNITSNIESKHLDLIVELATKGENGSRINLPERVNAYREYDYLTLTRKKVKERVNIEHPWKLGQIRFGEFGKLRIKLCKIDDIGLGKLIVDVDKVPPAAVWRLRNEGDYITKFGGGTKKLKSVLVDKKVPARLRDMLPVLAVDSEVFAVASVDISNHLKVDESTKKVAGIEYELFD